MVKWELSLALGKMLTIYHSNWSGTQMSPLFKNHHLTREVKGQQARKPATTAAKSLTQSWARHAETEVFHLGVFVHPGLHLAPLPPVLAESHNPWAATDPFLSCKAAPVVAGNRAQAYAPIFLPKPFYGFAW